MDGEITTTTMERRFFPVEEFRVLADGDGVRRLEGYAAVFDTLSEVIWDFREKIDSGAFAKTIKKDDIRALWNHNPDFVLGRNRAKPKSTLDIEEDDHGLRTIIYPPDTQMGRDAVISIERGDVSQMSFGFVTMEDSWEKDENKQLIRTLKKVRLFDVSPVAFPTYPDTAIQLRAMEIYQRAEREHRIPAIQGDGDTGSQLSQGRGTGVQRYRLRLNTLT